MLQLHTLAVKVNTKRKQDGQSTVFGATHAFQKGLNIIEGDTTVGKSTLYQCIFYALGMEDLLGGKDHIQTAVTGELQDETGVHYAVVDSIVYLQFECNGSYYTVARFIKTSIKNQEIFFRQEKSAQSVVLDVKQYNLIASKNEFHQQLRQWLGWSANLDFNGELDLKNIMAAFTIEQKKGWVDFLNPVAATQKSDIIEFLLKLDIFQEKLDKNRLSIKQSELQRNIETKRLMIQAILMVHPNVSLPYLNQKLSKERLEKYESKNALIYCQVTGKNLLLTEILKQWKEDLESPPNITDFIKQQEACLQRFEEQLKQLNQLILQNQTILWTCKRQINQIIIELEQYYDLEKIKILWNDNICPYCGQTVPNDVQHTHASKPNTTIVIEQLNKQRIIIEKRIIQIELNQPTHLAEKTRLESEIESSKKRIDEALRNLSVDVLIAHAQRKAILENNIKTYEQIYNNLKQYCDAIEFFVKEWQLAQKNINKFGEQLSKSDITKISLLERYFKEYMRQFNYTSTSIAELSISSKPTAHNSNHFLFPIILQGKSSASDFIRALWSYYCAVFRVSSECGGRHPLLLVFDEPAQHQQVKDDSASFVELTKVLTQFTQGQVLVFGSLNQTVRQGLDLTKVNLRQIKQKSIEKIS
jgi:DNA repair exonuclease SbcCD ATPase subunit